MIFNDFQWLSILQMKHVRWTERCWSTATRGYRALRRSPSPIWCGTPVWRWSRPTPWSNNADPSSLPISISWANCSSSNRACAPPAAPAAAAVLPRWRAMRSPRSALPRPTSTAPSLSAPTVATVPSIPVVTFACSTDAGPNSPLLKWTRAVVSDPPSLSLSLSHLLHLQVNFFSIFLSI